MLDKPLSKSALTCGDQCPRMLWIRYNMPYAGVSRDEQDTTMFEIGDMVGEAAQEFFGNTAVVETDRGFAASNYPGYVAQTQAYMDDPDVDCIAEATFYADEVIVFVDLLKREYDDNGNEVWDIYEVKASGIAGPHQAKDAAWQTLIAIESGTPIRDTYLLHPGFGGIWAFKEGRGDFEIVNTWTNWTKDVVNSGELKDQLDYFKEMVQDECPPACEGTPGRCECCNDPYTCNYQNKCRELFDEGY